MIEVTVQGIPCQAEMVNGYYLKPDPRCYDSDWDYAGGWFDIEFELYDRKGYRAKWLEKKMSNDDADMIVAQLQHANHNQLTDR